MVKKSQQWKEYVILNCENSHGLEKFGFGRKEAGGIIVMGVGRGIVGL